MKYLFISRKGKINMCTDCEFFGCALEDFDMDEGLCIHDCDICKWGNCYKYADCPCPDREYDC